MACEGSVLFPLNSLLQESEWGQVEGQSQIMQAFIQASQGPYKVKSGGGE